MDPTMPTMLRWEELFASFVVILPEHKWKWQHVLASEIFEDNITT